MWLKNNSATWAHCDSTVILLHEHIVTQSRFCYMSILSLDNNTATWTHCDSMIILIHEHNVIKLPWFCYMSTLWATNNDAVTWAYCDWSMILLREQMLIAHIVTQPWFCYMSTMYISIRLYLYSWCTNVTSRLMKTD